MKKSPKNIYATCRVAAGFNQEVAAAGLHVSARSLADYEAGRTVPGDDVVCRMIEMYQAPELAYLHLKYNTEVGRRYLPELCLDDLSKTVLRLQRESRHLKDIEADMIDIASDGIIEKSEIPAWERVRGELLDIAGAALAVLFTRKERAAIKTAR